MKILLAGATGFLGSNILKKLLELNFEVTILKRKTSDVYRISKYLENSKVFNIDEDNLNEIFKYGHFDVVINTVTIYGRNNETLTEIVESNLMFPLRLVEASVTFGVKAFINTDTLLDKYLNYYAMSKKHFVEFYRTFSKKITFINMRIEHMYGVLEGENKFSSSVLRQLIQNVEYINFTPGKQKRDFIYIDDVVEAYVVILKNLDLQLKFQEFDVATGNQISIIEFVTKMKNILLNYRDVKTELRFGALEYRSGEAMEVCAHIDSLLKQGWTPQINVQEGLEKMIKGTL